MSAIVLVLLLAFAVPAAAQYPEAVLASFCTADGKGERLHAAGAQALGDALGWRFEPAWDRVVLITGFEVRPLRADGEELEVRYTVVSEVSGVGVRENPHIETRRFRLALAGGGWRIVGPRPPPHLYAEGADANVLFERLMPSNDQYLSNSKFVWRMFHKAGWSIDYQPASEFLRSGSFKPVAEPAVGDVIAYLDGGAPYHVGIYEGEDTVASATVNGIVRTSLNAFPGEIRYLRLTEAARPTPVSAAPTAEDDIEILEETEPRRPVGPEP